MPNRTLPHQVNCFYLSPRSGRASMKQLMSGKKGEVDAAFQGLIETSHRRYTAGGFTCEVHQTRSGGNNAGQIEKWKRGHRWLEHEVLCSLTRFILSDGEYLLAVPAHRVSVTLVLGSMIRDEVEYTLFIEHVIDERGERYNCRAREINLWGKKLPQFVEVVYR